MASRISRDADEDEDEDEDDDVVLAGAITTKADAVVSGDQDSLVLRNVQGVEMLTVAQAMARIEQQNGGGNKH